MKTIVPQTLVDQINSLSRRLDNIEMGSKPFVNRSPIASVGGYVVTAGNTLTISTVLSWVNTAIQSNPDGTIYIAIFIDNDNNGLFLFPNGASLTASQLLTRVETFYDLADLSNNPNRCKAITRIKNESADSHTYYVYTGWLYLGGGSSSGI